MLARKETAARKVVYTTLAGLVEMGRLTSAKAGGMPSQ
jgi:NADH pyrophosphatase NudC (nudix superfamily)